MKSFLGISISHLTGLWFIVEMLQTKKSSDNIFDKEDFIHHHDHKRKVLTTPQTVCLYVEFFQTNSAASNAMLIKGERVGPLNDSHGLLACSDYGLLSFTHQGLSITFQFFAGLQVVIWFVPTWTQKCLPPTPVERGADRVPDGHQALWGNQMGEMETHNNFFWNNLMCSVLVRLFFSLRRSNGWDGTQIFCAQENYIPC